MMNERQELILMVVLNQLTITNGILSEILRKYATTEEDAKNVLFYKQQNNNLMKTINSFYEKEMKE